MAITIKLVSNGQFWLYCYVQLVKNIRINKNIQGKRNWKILWELQFYQRVASQKFSIVWRELKKELKDTFLSHSSLIKMISISNILNNHTGSYYALKLVNLIIGKHFFFPLDFNSIINFNSVIIWITNKGRAVRWIKLGPFACLRVLYRYAIFGD